jgi:hypothetical protein
MDALELSVSSCGPVFEHKLTDLCRIVANHVQSAIIIEDDSDWDVNLKHQLVEFAAGARALQQHRPAEAARRPAKSSPRPSPYGDDWDLLWLGHCRVGPSDAEQAFWVVDDDLTVPPVHHRRAGWRNGHYPDEVTRNHTRMVLRAGGGGMCTGSYAVTYEGARKMLTSLSLQSRDSSVDGSLSQLCMGRYAKPFDCYAPYPPLISTHRAAGPQSRDSDLNEKGDRWHREYSFDIVYSTIMNVPRLADGEATVMAQWEDVAQPELLVPDGREATPMGYLKTIDVRNQTTTKPVPFP